MKNLPAIKIPGSIRFPVWVVLGMMLASGISPAKTAEPAEVSQKIELKSLKFPPLPGSIEGGFAGNMGKVLLVAANPPAPAADGALSTWTCPPPSDAPSSASWSAAKVTVPAWAASTAWEGRWIVAGGMRGGKPVSEVSLLSLDAAGNLTSTSLPSLPQAVAGAGAAMIGTTLHVFGGVSSWEPAVFEKKLWKLEFTDGVPATSWSEGEGFPNFPRAFFATTSQYGMLCVFGGIGPDLKVSNEAWVYRPTPIEATSYIGWKQVGDLPHPSACASAVALGQASVMLVGGIQDGSIPSLPPPTTTARKDPRPWLYHTVTDAWCAFDQGISGANVLALKTDSKVLILDRDGTREASFPRMMRNLALIDYIVVIGYFVVLAAIGFYFAKQEQFSWGSGCSFCPSSK
ncbi:MAG: hypothetical protein MUF13_06640 [Akkermansiaceae bacterium]|nr:hypothetical protein [Akkermansiaceae bacterium]